MVANGHHCNPSESNSAIIRECPNILIYTLTLTAGVDIGARNEDGTPYFASFVHWYSALVEVAKQPHGAPPGHLDLIEFIQATSRVRTFAKNEGTLYMDVGAQGWTMSPAEYMRMINFAGQASCAFANGFTMPLTMQMECFLGARKHSLMARGAQVVLRELARFGWLLTFKSRLAIALDENSHGMKSMQIAASTSSEDIAQ